MFVKFKRSYRTLAPPPRLETGFSMLEAVVVVGVLLALAVGGFFAFGPITENAKIAKVKSTASEVHTGVLVASMDGDSTTTPQKVIDDWNGRVDKIKVELANESAGGGGESASGDFCVTAYNVESPLIKASTGSCAPGGGDGSATVPDTDGDGTPDSSDPDIDGDGTPNASDPDIDGDGIPNASDTTPNGGTNNGTNPPSTDTGGGNTAPVSSKCGGLTVEGEVTCWHDEIGPAQDAYEAENGHYFGIARYSNQPSYEFSPAGMEGTPLLWGTRQETYREEGDSQWDYNYWESAIADRDGYIWRGGYYHELYGAESSADEFAKDSGDANIHYDCDFVTPSDLNSLCTWVGINQVKYVVDPTNSDSVANNDSVAIDDVTKVVTAQAAALRSTGELHGGYGQTVDVKSWAGTAYEAKVWNYPTNAWSNNVYTRVMVVAPNGDLYTAQYRFYKPNAATASLADGPPRVYQYTDEHVDRVCSKPFINKYNQNSDIATCSTLGYADFRPAG